MNKRVAIIGAGAAGLCVAKCLLDEGIIPVIFEVSNKIGGLWKYDNDSTDGGGPAYESLQTNTSILKTAFKDYPFPDDYPNFPSRQQVLDYLIGFAQRFNLTEHVKFNHKVIKVDKVSDKFIVNYESKTESFTKEFDNVIVASGRHDVVNMPKINGLNTFKGDVLHSKDYTKTDKYLNKKVLIIGAGPSSVDIATDITSVSKEVIISSRTPVWYVPKYIKGKPYDQHLTKFKARLPKIVREYAYKRMLLQEYKNLEIKQNDGALPFGVPALDLEKARFVPTEKLFKCIDDISFTTNISSIRDNDVILDNKSEIKDVDAIIFATGYKVCYPFLAGGSFSSMEHDTSLYKHIFYPNDSSLSFVGANTIVGPILAALYYQALYISKVYAGKVKLPNNAEMLKKVEGHARKCRKKGIDKNKVQTLYYIDELERGMKKGFYILNL